MVHVQNSSKQELNIVQCEVKRYAVTMLSSIIRTAVLCGQLIKCDLDKSKAVELHAAFGASSGSGGDLEMAVWHPCLCWKF